MIIIPNERVIIGIKMKIEKYRLIIFLFFIVYAITNGQEITNKKVIEYGNFLKTFGQNLLRENDWENYSKYKQDFFVKKIFNAYRTDPIEIKKMFNKSRLDIIKECKSDRKKYNNLSIKKLGSIETILLSKLRKKLPQLAYELLNTHLLLKARVISKNEIEDKDKTYSDLSLRLVYLKIKIKEILIGNERIKNNDTLEVFYNKNWGNSNTTNWHINQIYLFSLNYRLMNDLSSLIAINTFSDHSNGYFPVMDSVLIDLQNHFGFGDKVKWNSFKNSIKENELFTIIGKGIK